MTRCTWGGAGRPGRGAAGCSGGNGAPRRADGAWQKQSQTAAERWSKMGSCTANGPGRGRGCTPHTCASLFRFRLTGSSRSLVTHRLLSRLCSPSSRRSSSVPLVLRDERRARLLFDRRDDATQLADTDEDKSRGMTARTSWLPYNVVRNHASCLVEIAVPTVRGGSSYPSSITGPKREPRLAIPRLERQRMSQHHRRLYPWCSPARTHRRTLLWAVAHGVPSVRLIPLLHCKGHRLCPLLWKERVLRI